MPAVELVMMIDPPPAVCRCGIAATQVFQTPVRLVSMVSCQICGVVSSQGWTVQMPAFAHDVEAAQLGDAVVDGGLERGRVADVGLGGDDPPVQVLDLTHCFGQVVGVAHRVADRVVVLAGVHGDDVGAFLRQSHGVTAALASGRPGDECDLALDPSHVGPPSATGRSATAGSVPTTRSPGTRRRPD